MEKRAWEGMRIERSRGGSNASERDGEYEHCQVNGKMLKRASRNGLLAEVQSEPGPMRKVRLLLYKEYIRR